MTEVKERIVDLGFEDTELKEESEIEEEKQRIFFPRIKPFYVPTIRPMYTLGFWAIL